MIPIFLFGIAVRLFFFIYGLFKMPIAVDESWVGVMAMHILKGEFPIVYWGQSYMGTQEAYFDAPLIWLFGPNAFSIRVYPFFWSILFIYVSYKLACKIYNPGVGLITLLLLALPTPYLSIASAVVQPDNYIAGITLGSLSLLVAYDINRKTLRFALLGFILGFAFWMHLVIVSYIGVVLLYLFLKDRLLIFRKGFWAFILAFIIGSLPLLLYNLSHNFATFHDVAWAAGFSRAIENLKGLFTTTFHFLLGTKVMLCADTGYYMNVPPLLNFIAVGLIIFVIITAREYPAACCGDESAINSSRNKILRGLPREYFIKKNKAGLLLFLMTVASIYTFCRSGRTNAGSVRYILPIMSVLPILFGYGLWEIKKFSRAVFYILISIFLLTHLWGNLLLARALNDKELVAEKLDLQDLGPVIEFLKGNNIRHAYSNYCIAYNLTYETNEEIICSAPYNERFTSYDVPFIEEVRESRNVAYIMHKNLGIKPGDFENRLRHIGGGYKKKILDSYTIFYLFEPPYEEGQLVEIVRDDWQVDSVNAIDGDLTTRWGSGMPQSPGMSFSIDMGRINEVARIRFDMGGFITDTPRGYKIDVSQDNKDWTTVLEIPDNIGGLFWEGSHPRFLVNSDFFTASFPPVKARFIRITQTGMDPRFDWSIAELHIYG